MRTSSSSSGAMRHASWPARPRSRFPLGFCLSVCLGVCLSCAAWAADETADAGAPAPVPESGVASPAADSVGSARDSRPIEEIEITGQRSLNMLRLEIRREEERMYEQFNALNGKREFDVQCGERIVTGSLIPVHECVPVYMKRAMSRNAQDFLQLGLLPKSEEELWWEHRDMHAELDAEIRALAVEHPEFGMSVIELHRKKERLEELEREQRERGGFFSRLFGRGEEDD